VAENWTCVTILVIAATAELKKKVIGTVTGSWTDMTYIISFYFVENA
jgi:hypothetical protein